MMFWTPLTIHDVLDTTLAYQSIILCSYLVHLFFASQLCCVWFKILQGTNPLLNFFFAWQACCVRWRNLQVCLWEGVRAGGGHLWLETCQGYFAGSSASMYCFVCASSACVGCDSAWILCSLNEAMSLPDSRRADHVLVACKSVSFLFSFVFALCSCPEQDINSTYA